MKKLLMGVDVGTSGIKVVIFDLEGNVLASKAEEVPIISKQQDQAEENMQVIWEKTSQAIRSCLTSCGEEIASSIAALGVTGQGTGCWLLDSNLEPIGNAIVWIDGRAKQLIDLWKEDGRHAEAFRLTSNSIFTGSPLAILAWLKENQPQHLQKARHLVFAKDWVKFKLTGKIATDLSDLFMLPYPIEGEVKEVLRLFDLLEVEDLLPPFEDPCQVIGEVTPQAAQATGLPAGIPVVNGVVDVVACAVALGILEAGQAYSILGTTCFNAFLTDCVDVLFKPEGVGITVAYPLPGLYLRSMATMSGTLSLDWFLNNFFSHLRERFPDKQAFFAHLEQEMQRVPPGAGGIIFLPYISPGGERAPFIDPHARGVFFGLSLPHDEMYILRSVYEGVAFSVLDCFQALATELEEIRLSGGGVKSSFWCQVLSDVLGVKVVVPRAPELGALGISMIAGVGVGMYKDLRDAFEKVFRVSKEFYPRLEHHRLYREKYNVYRTLREKLVDVWRMNDLIS